MSRGLGDVYKRQAVVLGALLLAGLYTLFGDTVLPTVTERVEEMFDYKG